jgi:hypothetical protein
MLYLVYKLIAGSFVRIYFNQYNRQTHQTSSNPAVDKQTTTPKQKRDTIGEYVDFEEIKDK